MLGTFVKVKPSGTRGHASCGHRTYKHEPYYLASVNDNILSLCVVCGGAYAKTKKVDCVVEPKRVKNINAKKGIMVMM